MTPDDLAAAMVPVACDPACLVRDGDRRPIARRLHSLLERQDGDAGQDDGIRRLYALVVVLAAMVPDDRTVPELLGWLEQGTPERDAMLAKAHSRAALRQSRGLPLWGPLAALDNEYHQRRKARGRAAGDEPALTGAA